MKTDNEIIAEFMGWKKNDWGSWISSFNGAHFDIGELHYDKQWDWLMPVVEKIHKVQPRAFKRDLFTGPISPLAELYITSSIGAVYKAVVDFIKWYNVSKDKTTE